MAVALLIVLVGGSSSDGSAAPATSASASGTPGPLRTTVPAPDAATQAICAPVLADMPVQLNIGDKLLSPLTVQPGGPTFLAWGDNPVVTVQCGVGRPAQLRSDNPDFHPYLLGTTDNSPDAVAWAVDEHGATQTWTTVDRSVYFRVEATAATDVAAISEVIGTKLPAVCKPGPDQGDPEATTYCGDRP